LVAGRKIRNLLRLAGLKDAWTTAKGSTPTMNSTSKAVLNLKLAGLKDAWTTAKGSTPTMNSTSKAVLNCLRQTFSQG